MVIDEVSMIGNQTMEDTDDTLQAIEGNDEHFGNVSILVVGDFFQLPPF